MSNVVKLNQSKSKFANQHLNMRAGLASKQKGISFLSVFFLIFVFLFIGVFAFKVGPSYLTNLKVQQVAKDAVSDTQLMESTRSDVLAYLKRGFRTNDVWDLKVKEILQVTRDENGKFMIGINYEERNYLLGNIDVVTKFQKEIKQP